MKFDTLQNRDIEFDKVKLSDVRLINQLNWQYVDGSQNRVPKDPCAQTQIHAPESQLGQHPEDTGGTHEAPSENEY